MTVRELRKKLGWSQMKMANEVGVGRVAVARWEGNLRNPCKKTLDRLSQIASANGIDGFSPNCPCCGRPL